MNQYIEAVSKCGQSIWYDNLSRNVLGSGELESIIAKGVTGLTSNPAIFHKAIAGSEDYDQSIRELASDGLSVEELTMRLMIEDVAAAADLLLPVYQNTDGLDGYASIEVSPELAGDTDATVAAAREIWSSLNRPNIMIKVPATPEGIPAIGELLGDGINVNVTLLFSPEIYRKVLDTWSKAMEVRLLRGDGINRVSSVASVFVSRLDSLVEKKLKEKISNGEVNSNLLKQIDGLTGIANCLKVYDIFNDFCQSATYSKLTEADCKVQRPLWGSTGTKNPDFSPLLYIERLALKSTVNTVPPATLSSIIEGPLEVSSQKEGYESVVRTLREAGLSPESLYSKLLDDGVQSFIDAWRALLVSVEEKAGVL